jgi:4'-phosphopantetheinyl transferase
VLGVSRGGPVGADVEQLRERHSIERVARRALGPAARDAIAAAPARRRLERFYRCWTAAEASAKAGGAGLPALLGDRPPPMLPVTWLEPAPGYVAAVASPRQAPRVRIRELH